MLREPDVQCVAICDARKSQRLAVKQIIDEFNDNKDCKMYSDMREFLAERTDIDAVLTATGGPLACHVRHHDHAFGQGCLFRKAFLHDHR